MPYYNDPSGLGSWWVNEGEDPYAAYQRMVAPQVQTGQGLANSFAAQGFDTTGLNIAPDTGMAGTANILGQAVQRNPSAFPNSGYTPPITQPNTPLRPPLNPPGGGLPDTAASSYSPGTYQAQSPTNTAPISVRVSDIPNAPDLQVDPTTGWFGTTAQQQAAGAPAVATPNYFQTAQQVPGFSMPTADQGALNPSFGQANSTAVLGTPTQAPGTNTAGLIPQLDELGNEFGPPIIPEMNLPGVPQMSPYIDQGVRDQFTGMMNTIAGQAGDQYNYTPATFNTAQMDTSKVPQPSATTMNISPEVQRMLSGQGFNPATLAQMKASAIENAAGAGRNELSQSKIAMEQAGLSGSPAGAAIQGDVARREGIAQSSALRDVDIQNALAGLQNFQLGVGYQQQTGLSNMQAANQMALENANRLFSAMNANLANQQQAANATFGAETNRQQAQAGTKADFLTQQGGALNAASLGNALNANQTNTANLFNRQSDQAQLDRQRQLANLQANEGRWQTSAAILGGFAPNPKLPETQGFSPLGAQLGNLGSSFLNNTIANLGKPKTSTSGAT